MAMAAIAGRPSPGISGTSTTAHTIVTTLNIAGESAGTKKWCSEFSIPMNTAASATNVRNGSITRVSCTVRSSLPGHVAVAFREERHQRLGEEPPGRDQHAGDDAAAP